MAIKLSVIIISYNQSKYIRQAIKGVVSQKTNFPYEVIIADDCSTDNTLDICKEYVEKYPSVRIEQNTHNIGYTANWEKALRLGIGKYVAIFEADDYWEDPLKLQKQVDVLDLHENVGLCYTDCNIYYEKDRKITKDIVLNNISHIDVKNPLNSFGYLCNVSWLMRRSFIDKVECFLDCLDYPLHIFYEACAKTEIIALNVTTSTFRVHKGSLSNSDKDERRYNFTRGLFLIQENYVNNYSPSESSYVYTKCLVALYNDALQYNDTILINKLNTYFNNVDIGIIMDLKKEIDIAYHSKTYKLGSILLTPIRSMINLAKKASCNIFSLL